MHTIANAIIVLWGWRRVAAAILAGMSSALALPPWSAFPVLWLTMPILIWLIDGAVAPPGAGWFRRLVPGAIVGWSFGFGYFFGGLWWVGAAFLVDATNFAWLLPVAVVFLSAGLALFWAFGAVLARLFWPDGWPRILVFAAAFSFAEWLRGNVWTGFPWNSFGYTLTPAPVMMQSAAVIGLWGLTLAAFVVFSAPALLAVSDRESRDSRHMFLAFAAAVLVVHVGFGVFRLAGAPDATLTDVRLRIVQPAIKQSEKWQEENEDEIFKLYLQLSDAAISPQRNGIDSATVIVWPETAIPFFLTERPDALAALAELLPDGTTLLTGANRSERAGDDEPVRVFNSVYAVGDDGEILAVYDKTHLVPFGEYLPFQSVLEAMGLRQLTGLEGGYTAGNRRRTLTLADMPPLSPLICYEIIFPGDAVDHDDRPEWLLNLTNDAWFGDSPGPRQHFLQARLRAVEEGLPLVRAANSGISAIVDANGRVAASLGVGRAGVVDGELPVKLPPTPYSLYGGWVFFSMLITSLIAAIVGQIRSSKRPN